MVPDLHTKPVKDECLALLAFLRGLALSSAGRLTVDEVHGLGLGVSLMARLADRADLDVPLSVPPGELPADV